jgi:hypothetical protein
MPSRSSQPRRSRAIAAVLALALSALHGCKSDAPSAPTEKGSIALTIGAVETPFTAGDTILVTLNASVSGGARVSQIKLTATGAATRVDSVYSAPQTAKTMQVTFAFGPLAAPDTLVLTAVATGTGTPGSASTTVALDESAIDVVQQISVTPAVPKADSALIHIVLHSVYPMDSINIAVWNAGYHSVALGGVKSATLDFPYRNPGCGTGKIYIGTRVFAGAAHAFERDTSVNCLVPPWLGGATRSDDANYILLNGDHVRVTVYGYHQGAPAAPIRWVGYQIGPPVNVSDSFQITGIDSVGPISHDFDINVTPAWLSGASPTTLTGVNLYGFTYDDAGYYAYTSLTAMTVTQAVRRPTAVAALTTRVVDAAYDAKRGHLLLAQPDSQRIAVLDVATWTFLAPIPVGGHPWGIDLSPSGDTVLAVLDHTWRVEFVPIGGGAHLVVGIPGTGSQWLRHLRVTANGKAFVTTTHDGYGDGELWEMDLGTFIATRRMDVGYMIGFVDGSITESGTLARSGDGQKMMVYASDACCPIVGQVYDAGTDSLTPIRAASGNDFAAQISMSGTGARIGVGNRSWDGTLTTSSSAYMPTQYGVTPFDAPASAVSYDGTEYYLGWPTGFFRLRADGSLIETVRLPVAYQPAHYNTNARILPLPDGHTVIVMTDTAVVRVTLP